MKELFIFNLEIRLYLFTKHMNFKNEFEILFSIKYFDVLFKRLHSQILNTSKSQNIFTVPGTRHSLFHGNPKGKRI